MTAPIRAVLVGLLPRNERAISLGLGYLKAFADSRPDLTGGARVWLLDFPADAALKGLVERILKPRPRVVGFSANLCNFQEVRAAARRIRARAPDIFLVLGAQEASLRPEVLLRSCSADAAVIGEGEETFAELLGALAGGRSLEEVKGLVLRKGRAFLRTPRRALLEDLSGVASPYLSGFFPFAGKPSAETVLETTRGCPFRCGYCSWPNGAEPRHFPLERVRAEIREILAHEPAGLVHIADPDIFIHPERALNILGWIREADPRETSRWWFNTYLGNMTARAARLCDHSGFIIECGIQTVNPRALMAARRRFDAGAVRRGFEFLRRLAPKARVRLQIILGLPGDDLGGFLASLDWCYGLGTDKVHVFPMQLMRGTDLHRRQREFGVIADPGPPYLVRATTAFPARDLARARRIIYALQLFMRHRGCREALEAAPVPASLSLRAESLARRLAEVGVDMEAAFQRWDEAGSRYLTPLTIGSDPCASARIEEAARQWAGLMPEPGGGRCSRR